MTLTFSQENPRKKHTHNPISLINTIPNNTNPVDTEVQEDQGSSGVRGLTTSNHLPEIQSLLQN